MSDGISAWFDRLEEENKPLSNFLNNRVLTTDQRLKNIYKLLDDVQNQVEDLVKSLETVA